MKTEGNQTGINIETKIKTTETTKPKIVALNT